MTHTEQFKMQNAKCKPRRAKFEAREVELFLHFAFCILHYSEGNK